MASSIQDKNNFIIALWKVSDSGLVLYLQDPMQEVDHQNDQKIRKLCKMKYCKKYAAVYVNNEITFNLALNSFILSLEVRSVTFADG